MAENKLNDTDMVIRRLRAGTESTESIDIFSLFSPDVTTTGSFDLRGVERSSLGKLLRALPMPAFLINPSRSVMFFNGAIHEAADLSDRLIGRSILELFPRSDHARLVSAVIRDAFVKRKPQVTEAIVQLEERTMWGKLHVRTLRMGTSRLLLVLIEDLTLEKKQSLLDRKHKAELSKARDELELRVQQRTAQLSAANERMRLEIVERKRIEADLKLAGRIIECSNEAIMITDPAGIIVRVNEAFSRITGYCPEEVVGQMCTAFHWGPPDADISKNIWQSLRETGAWQGEVWDRHRSGKFYPKLLSISSVRDRSDQVTQYVGIFSDISKLKETEKRLVVLAHYDSLTGLPNRVLFRTRLKQALEDGARNGLVGVMLLDLDRFKNINETMGHRFGDKVLRAVAKTLTKCLPRSATAARLGGDEFAVFLPDASDRDEIARAAIELIDSLSAPMVIDRREVFVTASFGIALCPFDGDKVDLLLRNADTALHYAKERGKNRFRFFSRSMNAVVLRQQKLEHLIRVGLLRNEFLLHYQPVVDVAAKRIVGAEALLRWRHPDRGPVSAEKLVPIAEDCGLILPLGEWVFRTACEQNRRWQTMGLPPIRMAVNFSGRQLKEQSIIHMVKRIIEETGLDPSFVEIELTESVMMEDRKATQNVLSELKKQGIGIAIDDFGTGYSSLSYLKDLPADKLKIDKSFVQEVSSDSFEQAIVRAVLAVAHSRGLLVVAEGVESVEQFNFLRANRCDHIQGYYVSRPVGADVFTRLLTEDPRIRALFDGQLGSESVESERDRS